MSRPADAQEILRARARALAQVPAPPAAQGTLLELLEFKLAHERYAVESRFVQEVQPLRELTPLPGTPAFVRGIVNVRGRIVAVFDLKQFFGLADQGVTDLHRIILIQDSDVEIGLLADVVVGVRPLPLDSLQPSLPTMSGIAQKYLKGITADGWVVLDAPSILGDPKIIVHDDYEG